MSMGTPFIYGAKSQAEFQTNFPVVHKLWLDSLPWARWIDDMFFVHAGLPLEGKPCYHSEWNPPSFAKQLQELATRDISVSSTHS